MERIRVSKVYPGLAKFFMIFGIIFSILGFSLLIKSLIRGFNVQFPSGDWNSVTFAIQGLLFILLGYSNLKSGKYFIEWDDNELRFLLPDTRKVEVIKFDQIQSVIIRLFEIELKLTNSTRTLNLDNLQFEDLRKVKDKFEHISNPLQRETAVSKISNHA
jgi:hypothetical protein